MNYNADAVSVYTPYRPILKFRNLNRYREGKNGIGASLNNMVQKTIGMAPSGPALSSTHAGIIQGTVSLHHLALSVDQELNPRKGEDEGREVRMWIHTPLEH